MWAWCRIAVADTSPKDTAYSVEFEEGDQIEIERDEQAKKLIELSQRPDIYEVAMALCA